MTLEKLTLTASTQIGVTGGLLCKEMKRKSPRGMKESICDPVRDPTTISTQVRSTKEEVPRLEEPSGSKEQTVLETGSDGIQLLAREESWTNTREIFQYPRKFDGKTTKMFYGSVDSISISNLMDHQICASQLQFVS